MYKEERLIQNYKEFLDEVEETEKHEQVELDATALKKQGEDYLIKMKEKAAKKASDKMKV